MNKQLLDIKNFDMESVIAMINTVSGCLDEFLFVREIQTNRVYLSPNATMRFAVDEYDFIDRDNYFENHLIYEEDRKLVSSMLYSALVEDANIDFFCRWNGRDGSPVWVHSIAYVIKDDEGIPKYFFGSTNEIGQKRIADDISGLKGERLLIDEYEKLVAQGKRGRIIRFGIDHFKEINENHGIDYGDMVIRNTAQCIKKAVTGLEEVYRISGDEFVILDFNDDDFAHSVKIYERATFEVNDFIISNNYDSFYTISAGIVDIKNRTNVSYDAVMRRAEFALNEAKRRGRNQYYEFNPEDYDTFKKSRQILNELRRSVAEGYDGFDAFFQPIVDHDTNKLVGAEALMRYKDMEGKYIPPVVFIPLLEESGLIIPAGRWIVSRAVEMCQKMQELIPGFYIGINISYVQIRKSNVLDLLINIKNKSGLPDGSLVIEITESGEIECDESFIDFCSKLRENGILLALDDFGTGYSNFHYLNRLRPNTMKIDRTFTVGAINSEYEMELLKSMSEMAHSIGLKTVIEGIETDAELEKISMVSPDYIQGYYFGKPMPVPEFMTFVSEYV